MLEALIATLEAELQKPKPTETLREAIARLERRLLELAEELKRRTPPVNAIGRRLEDQR